MHRSQLTKHEIYYITTVKELKDMVTRELCIEGEINLGYDSHTLDDDMILMKDEHLRLATYPLLLVSPDGKTDISSFPTTNVLLSIFKSAFLFENSYNNPFDEIALVIQRLYRYPFIVNLLKNLCLYVCSWLIHNLTIELTD